MSLELIRPSPRVHSSFLDALGEFQAAGESLDLDEASIKSPSSFETYVQFLLSCEFRDPPYAGVVLWWVDGPEFIGRSLIRHHPEDERVASEGSIGYTVRPSYRRQGHAVKLLNATLRVAESLSVTPSLAIYDSNYASLATARAAGFVRSNHQNGVSFFSFSPPE